jgi:hypothetical protein
MPWPGSAFFNTIHPKPIFDSEDATSNVPRRELSAAPNAGLVHTRRRRPSKSSFPM